MKSNLNLALSIIIVAGVGYIFGTRSTATSSRSRPLGTMPSWRNYARFLTAHMTTKSMPRQLRFVRSRVIAQR